MMDSRLLPRGLKRAIDLIQRDFARPWTVPQLASASGVARRTLQTQFRRFIGASPLQFLRETRLAEARRQFVRAESTTTGTSATVATAPTVSPSVLAIPKNFRVDRNLGEEIIFAWDINTEAGVTGYAMFIYDGDTEKEVIDIPGKDVDNYNLILKDHLLLSLNKSYNVKLAAKK